MANSCVQPESPDFNSEDHHGQFVVIGGGPAGLTAALELTKRNHLPVVLEKGSLVGGISRTEEYKNYRFDMGGHRFFTKSEPVNEFWRQVLLEDFLTRPRLSRIYYRNTFFSYPLKPLNALLGLGPIEAVRILASYLRWTLFPYRVEETFEQWVTNRFGKRLFEIFFRSYTEKVWGIPCSELRAEWAAQRIKNLSLRSAVIGMFLANRGKVTSLIEQFQYPRLGPGMLWERVSEMVEERGGEVKLECDVVGIQREGNRITSVEITTPEGTRRVAGDQFISSMPVTEFIRRLDPPPPDRVLDAAAKLKYRDFLTVCLIIEDTELFPDNWIYIHEPNVQVGRIQNFGNWSPEMVPEEGTSSLGLEYFCNEGDALWNTEDKDLIAQATRELEVLGLVSSEKVRDGVVYRVPKTYPVYDSEYKQVLGEIRSYIDGLENFQTIGRNGLHRYNNQDHAMLTGMLAVKNCLDGESNDLWVVNADKQYHEEIREPKEIDAVDVAVATVFRKLDRVSMGLAAGTLVGLFVFLATLFLVFKGGDDVGQHLGLLSQYMPGYDVTFARSFVGLLYGFAYGFAGGWLTAFVRNSAMLITKATLTASDERRVLRRLLDYI